MAVTQAMRRPARLGFAAACAGALALGAAVAAHADPATGTTPTRISTEEMSAGGTSVQMYAIQKQSGGQWTRATDATGTADVKIFYPATFLKMMAVMSGDNSSGNDATFADTPIDVAQRQGLIAPATAGTFGGFFSDPKSRMYYGTYGASIDYSGDATYAPTRLDDKHEIKPADGKAVPRIDINTGAVANGKVPVTVTVTPYSGTTTTPTGQIGVVCQRNPAPTEPPAQTAPIDPSTVPTASLVNGTATASCDVGPSGDYFGGAIYLGDTTFAPAINFVRFTPSTPVTSKGISSLDPLAPGATTVCTAGSVKPNTTYVCAFHSDPTVLGEFTTDAHGNGSGTFTLPANAPAGVHHFTLTDKGTGEVTDGAQFVISTQAAKASTPVTVTFGTTAGGNGNGNGGNPTPTPNPQPGPSGSVGTGSLGNLLGGFGSSK